MNPLELAKKIIATVADYDVNTAAVALDSAKLMVHHREVARLQFNSEISAIAGADTSQCA